MENSKLISLLRTFDDSEFRRFDKFVKSPYCNNSKAIQNLWEQLKKYSPNYAASGLDTEKFFKKVFPKEAYDEKKLRQLRSRLLKLIEEFLAIEQFKKDEFLVQQKLAKDYYEKDLYHWFEEGYRNIIDFINKKSVLNELDYLQLNQLHHELFFNQRSKKSKPNPPDLEACSHQLNHYYELKKLKYLCEWKCRTFFTKEDLPERLVGQRINTENIDQELPLFQLYQRIYTMFDQGYELSLIHISEPTRPY